LLKFQTVQGSMNEQSLFQRCEQREVFGS
jgi:hypothetical protein